MTIILIVAIYLVGAVLAWGRAFASRVPVPGRLIIATCSYIGLFVGCTEGKWDRGFLCFRNPDKLAAKREAKKLRQEEIQRRIKANSFDFDVRPIPQMYSWMK